MLDWFANLNLYTMKKIQRADLIFLFYLLFIFMLCESLILGSVFYDPNIDTCIKNWSLFCPGYKSLDT